MIRRRYIFTGYVQGVGFRWRARQAAALHGCTVWDHAGPREECRALLEQFFREKRPEGE